MKKYYLNPEIEILELETVGMLASSLGGQNDDTVLGDNTSTPVGDDFDPGNY